MQTLIEKSVGKQVKPFLVENIQTGRHGRSDKISIRYSLTLKQCSKWRPLTSQINKPGAVKISLFALNLETDT
jgi:hypothetical protein